MRAPWQMQPAARASSLGKHSRPTRAAQTARTWTCRWFCALRASCSHPSSPPAQARLRTCETQDLCAALEHCSGPTHTRLEYFHQGAAMPSPPKPHIAHLPALSKKDCVATFFFVSESHKCIQIDAAILTEVMERTPDNEYLPVDTSRSRGR